MKTKKLILGAVIFLSLIFVFSAWAEERDCAKLISTTEGMVQGKQDAEHSACFWKGIPYAKPPIGELRFRAPEWPEKRDDILKAYEVGYSCPQSASLTAGGESLGYSEDCLSLNIFSPRKAGKFPVMVWLHGGAFMQGSGGYEMYDGARLAGEKDVVVVTINYRLGILGFLALPELAKEDEHNSTGNYGILDQVQALKWLQKNIASFGGEPNNITIFGQSAGGTSVCVLLVSPLAKGLFHRAIPLSGPCDLLADMEKGYKQGKEIIENMGCSDQEALSCLRAKSVSDFVAKPKNTMLAGGVTYSPHIDGYVIPDEPLKLIQQGKFNRVPIMVGTTKEELKLYTMTFSGQWLLTKGEVNFLIKKLMGKEIAKELPQYYSYSDYRLPKDLLIGTATDLAFSSRAFLMAEYASAYVPVYFYRFDWNKTRYPNKLGAFHGLDIPFVFGAMDLETKLAKMLANKKSYKQGEPLAEQMMSYYTNFARNGDPNQEGLVKWEPYSSQNQVRIYFNIPITTALLTEKELSQYNYWTKYSLSQLQLNQREKREKK